jgi:hypothetical protein
MKEDLAELRNLERKIIYALCEAYWSVGKLPSDSILWKHDVNTDTRKGVAAYTLIEAWNYCTLQLCHSRHM